MIVTKKGAKNKGLGVSFNSGIGFEVVNKLPVMQNQYGGGYEFTPVEINGKTYNTIDYNSDESWGPAYDGTTQYLSWLDLAKWEQNGQAGDPTTSTWKAPANDIKRFFETGVSLTNNVSVSQATDNASVRVSYTNTSLKGYMPNSHLSKNVFNMSGTAKVAKIYEVFSNITYLNQAATGRPETGYGDNNVMQKFIQWGERQLDMKELKSMYKNSDGVQVGWNRNAWDDATLAYSNNPYWSRYMNYENDTRNRVYGDAGAKANLLKNLSAQFKTSLDFFSDKRYARNAVYSQEESYYGETQRQQYEINHELMAQYNTAFDDLTLNVNAGANLMYRNFQSLTGYTVSGLVIPEFYNLINSKSPAHSENYLSKKAVNSVFANATLGYKSLAYLDGTYRIDKSSTLPVGKNVYSYFSGTGSIILSELIKQDWLSFSKARLSFAKVGGDTDPYRTNATYTFYTGIDGDHGYQLPVIKNNPDLKPEQTYSTEFGLESNFLKDRVGFDLTLYNSRTVDQITNISLSGATGYTSQILNAGTMENRGVELKLNGSPVKSKDFEWTVTLTAAHNKNTVKKLIGDLQYLRIANAPFKVEVGAYVGKEYGVIMGTDYVYDANGNKVVGDDGLYESTSGNVPLGSVNPTITGGLLNTFRYKNFDCSVLFDGQAGGKFFSTSYMWGIYSGMLDETAGYNELGKLKRDDPADGGGVLLPGVHEDGTANTTRLDAETWASGYYSGPAAQDVFKSDFIKLR
ncbi:MAG: TonB-dependent receptor, partial [Bacteroidota bacterium]|nr:TonB-dependent receptor [Bacteroidota bacterium]